jgi:hypothetical protein
VVPFTKKVSVNVGAILGLIKAEMLSTALFLRPTPNPTPKLNPRVNNIPKEQTIRNPRSYPQNDFV